MAVQTLLLLPLLLLLLLLLVEVPAFQQALVLVMLDGLEAPILSIPLALVPALVLELSQIRFLVSLLLPLIPLLVSLLLLQIPAQ